MMLLCIVVLLIGCVASRRQSTGPYFGAQRIVREAHLSKRAGASHKDVLQNPSTAQLSAYLQALTSEPRLFGTNGSANNAAYIHDELTKALAGVAGARVDVLPFTALANQPLERVVTYAPTAGDPPVQLVVDEPPVPGDPTSGMGFGLFNGYAGNSDDAVGLREVVYGNYCRLDDFNYLARLGVIVQGRVVLCRYGGIFRGQKALFAQQFGAASVLIYSDPYDDGFVKGAEYPAGPGRNGNGGQRGTLAYGWLCPGDPSPARIATGICGNLTTLTPTIPVQPLAWSQAEPLLRGLTGPYVSFADNWQGGLPFHYRVGPGPVVARVQLRFDYATRDGRNVIARIPGSESGSVMMGCHHDAWVTGASDPESGIAVLLEVARLFGKMYGLGWRPKRTLELAAFDGEEYGLLGSTNYVDTHLASLSDLLAYVNIDGVVGNWFQSTAVIDMATSPVLAQVLLDAMAETPSPNHANASCLDANFDGYFAVLGSGSDYTAFIDRAGVSSANFGWGNRFVGSPQYHSAYDSFHLMSTICDPGFLVHKASCDRATLAGLIMYSLSTDTVIHWSPNTSAASIDGMQQRLVAQFPAASQADWAHFAYALDQYAQVAASVQQHVDALHAPNNTETVNSTTVNYAFAAVERAFLTTRGIPGRTYYRHQLQAPDVLNDYNSQVLPAIAYWAAATPVNMVALQGAIDELTSALETASALVSRVGGYSSFTPREVAGIIVGCVLGSLIAGMILFALYKRFVKPTPAKTGFERLEA